MMKVSFVVADLSWQRESVFVCEDLLSWDCGNNVDVTHSIAHWINAETENREIPFK